MTKKLLVTALIAVACTIAIVASIATAQTAESGTAGKPEFKLPPGWTEEDMKSVMEAGTPGKMHELLVKGAGEWSGKNTMWMVPGAEPTTTDCTSTVTPIMGGRFIKCEWSGEMPGMGPYEGFGIQGYDNVTKKFVSIWIDNHGTGLMNGDGTLSPDGKTLTWDYKFTCPVTRKPMTMQGVETITGPDTKTLEMTGTDPKSGKEFKMMSVELTRIGGERQAGG